MIRHRLNGYCCEPRIPPCTNGNLHDNAPSIPKNKMLNKKLFLAKECEQLDQDYGGDQEEDAGHEGGEGQRL